MICIPFSRRVVHCAVNMEVLSLKREARAMVKLLKQLENEERELLIQNQILAREALLNGYTVELILEPPLKSSRKRKSPSAEKRVGGGSSKVKVFQK
jgi:hypothetical protein